MKFIRFFKTKEEAIFLNLQDVKKITISEDRHTFEMLSGETYYLESLAPEGFDDARLFEEFLESERVLYNQYLQSR